MAKKQNILTSFKPQNYSGFVESTLELEKAKAVADSPALGMAELISPIKAELERQVKVTEEAADTFIQNMPDDFRAELVPTELQAELTEQLNTYKSEYLEGVELLSRHANNTNSAKYKEGVAKTEAAKTKMMNTYNGLQRLQGIRDYEISNKNTRGWSEDSNKARANNIITGLNADQIDYDEMGNPILNDGFGDSIAVNDYKRTAQMDLQSFSIVQGITGNNAHNAGKDGMNFEQFQINTKNELAKIKLNKDLANQLFFMGVNGDETNATSVVNYLKELDVNNDNDPSNDKTLEKDANGNIMPPSKSEKNMQLMLDFYQNMADESYERGSTEKQSAADDRQINLPKLGGYKFPSQVRELLQEMDSGKNVYIDNLNFHYRQDESGKWQAHFEGGEKVAKSEGAPISFNSTDDMKRYFGLKPSIVEMTGYEYTEPETTTTELDDTDVDPNKNNENNESNELDNTLQGNNKPIELKDESDGYGFFGKFGGEKGSQYRKVEGGWEVSKIQGESAGLEERIIVTEQEIFDARKKLKGSFVDTDEEILTYIAKEKAKTNRAKIREEREKEVAPKKIMELKDLPKRTIEEFNSEKGVPKKMSEIAAKHKFDVMELYKIIEKETGGSFATNVKSGTSNAVGLIQFMPNTIKDLDPSLDSEKVAAMTVLEQLDLVDKYFTKYGKKGAHPYLVVASPKAATMKPNEILYASGSKQAEANPSWQNENGDVTPNSILTGMGFEPIKDSNVA